MLLFIICIAIPGVQYCYPHEIDSWYGIEPWAGVPASVSMGAGAGGPVQADRTNILNVKYIQLK